MNWVPPTLSSTQIAAEGHQPTTIVNNAAGGQIEGTEARSGCGGGYYPLSLPQSTSTVLEDDDDDRRPNTPRNVSPIVGVPDDTAGNGLDTGKDELLVFGYGCKIFRNDERAKWIEEHKHLIPWMGHPNLLIDRYDCRGALMDISRYEPGANFESSGDDQVEDTLIWEEEEVSESEMDEERYRDLNEDEDYDEGAYGREVDYNRLQTAINGMVSESRLLSSSNEKPQTSGNYAAFQYNYDEQAHDICMGPAPKRLHEEDAPYVKPVGLYIPEEIILPTTTKIHAIIEKTAQFIASQGNQMEIILKTKQSGNQLFDFLNHSGALNPYYKFLVHAIRNGIYRPAPQDEMDSTSDLNLSADCSGSEEDADHTYLHPSLFRASSSLTTSAPVSAIDSLSSSYSSSTSNPPRHNAYTMLVSKIKGTDSPDPITSSSLSYPHQQPNYFGQVQTNTTTLVNNYGLNIPMLQLQQQQQPQPVAASRPQKQLPSTQDQLIIEKMASYVIKNGANFEELAKKKGDTRFGFLNPSHEYHWYYLNCKQRFKAECSAVVASSDFINYTTSGSSGAPGNSGGSVTGKPCATSTSPRKSALVAELAELKRKNSVLLVKKEAMKEKLATISASTSSGVGQGSSGGNTSTENIFSQANLVSSNKEKDKPVIRFSSTLSLNNLSPTKEALTQKSPSGPIGIKGDPKRSPSSPGAVEEAKAKDEQIKPKVSLVSVQTDSEEEEGLIHSNSDKSSDSDVFPLDDNSRGGSSPASEDGEEKARRRLERRRKAALFLQKLKMSKIPSAVSLTTKINKVTIPLDTSKQKPLEVTAAVSSTPAPLPHTSLGSSLGDLLSRRLQSHGVATDQERSKTSSVSLSCGGNNISYLNDEENYENHRRNHRVGGEDFDNGARSSGSSNYSNSSRSRRRSYAAPSSSSRSRKSKRRRRSRSYSSTVSLSSSPASSCDSSHVSYSKKKSSKRKHKKKKKKHEKSSSRKSKRR